jgi:hypothetical protein
MNTIPQITSAEPKIKIPAWRRASPKNLNTRPLKMSPKASPQKRMMSPSEASQSFGTESQPTPGEAERVAGRAASCESPGGYPPMGALGFAPQKTWLPIMPIRCTSTMFKIIDLAVACPTPTGPPEAV